LVGQVKIAPVVGEKDTGNQTERKYLSLMGMSRKLQIEQPVNVGIHDGLMFEEQCKVIPV
jgi:hypothetical protein